MVNISASPYHAGKGAARERMLATRAADNVIFVAFCNLVGGQDELVFDGGSVILDERGEVVARARQFEEDLIVADLDLTAVFRQQLHDPRRRKERALLPAEAVDSVELARNPVLPTYPVARQPGSRRIPNSPNPSRPRRRGLPGPGPRHAAITSARTAFTRS